VIKFITGRPLWANVLFAILVMAILIFLFLSSLTFFTRHGSVLRIPPITGKSFADAKMTLEAQGFEVEIQDSIYIDTLPPLSIIRQFPDAGSLVKVNRTVYLTVNRSVPPEVAMPNLVGMSFRNAELVLRQFGLKLGDTTFKPDFAKNSILNQTYNGKEIAPGAKLPMGSVISLVLGSGLSNVDMGVPDLFGLTYSQAKSLLDAAGIGFGSVVPDSDMQDTGNAFIYRQSPSRLGEDNRVNRIRPGQMIDVWLSTQKPERPDSTLQAPTSEPQ
jgi:beta-lactam-binding protein with PASTA domain